MSNDDTGLAGAGEPILSAQENEHCRRVRRHIAQRIEQAGGWLDFEHYMDLALYAPGLGYYSAGARKIGRDGDFTTAPEISGLFGRCVARQCAQVLADLGRGWILEIGAGTGRLAVDILNRLSELGRLPERYLILEISADLRERQRRLIERQAPQWLGRVQWLDAPPAQAFDGVILANEVADALPVTRFAWSRSGISEMGVGLGAAGFQWQARVAAAPVAGAVAALHAAAGGGWQDGYVSEFCPRLEQWSATAARALRRGLALWFDYGLPRAAYYLPERRDGTLLTHFRHRSGVDPFRFPGLEDITAWVDFTRLAEAGAAADFAIAGFTTQAHFLAGAGIEAEIHAVAAADANLQASLSSQARQLLLPGQMGESFKAMAWSRNLDLELMGFALRDFTVSL